MTRKPIHTGPEDELRHRGLEPITTAMHYRESESYERDMQSREGTEYEIHQVYVNSYGPQVEVWRVRLPNLGDANTLKRNIRFD